MLGEESEGVLHGGWYHAALPHQQLSDEEVWKVRTDRVTVVIEPGRRNLPGSEIAWAGVPFGHHARLILLYLQAEALRVQHRDVELGRCLRTWVRRLGLPVSRESLKQFREQADRLSRCRLTLHVQGNAGRTRLEHHSIVESAVYVDGALGGQEPLFIEAARLSEAFFQNLTNHPVPFEETAVRAIGSNSRALDIYCWLARRLHLLSSAQPISWDTLYVHFGIGDSGRAHFKRHFLDNLKIATAVYPSANLHVDSKGLVLQPSRAPVAPRFMSRSRGQAIVARALCGLSDSGRPIGDEANVPKR